MAPDDYTAEENDLSPTVNLGEWINTFVLAALPLVGFVLLCTWAFGRTTPPSKANWAKAMLLLYALVLVLGLALLALTMLAKPTDQQILVGPSYKVVP